MKQKRQWITMSLLGALLAWPVALGQESVEVEVALRAAMETETVEGDLKDAIAQYEKLAEIGDRPIAARALIRMAGCYEKLGVAESRKIYERVLRDYADQKEAAKVARARLDTIDRPTAIAGDRVVWAGEVFGSGRVSPDGRFFSETDWNDTGNLMLYDLQSGEARALTGNTKWGGGNAMGSSFSPDGKQIAFGWQEWEPHRCDLRIVNFEERGVPEARRVYANEDLRFLDVTDWSSNGRWLAVHLGRLDHTGQIGIFDLQKGSLTTLRSVGWRGPGKIFFSPDGRYIAYDLHASDLDSHRDVFVMAVDGSLETRVVEHPAQDRVMGWSPDGRHLLFASNRIGRMGLWAVAVSDGRATATPALIKPEIGLVDSLGVTVSGALHIARDASTQGLQVAPFDLKSGRLAGVPVVQAYRSARPDWSADGKYLAYRSEGTDGSDVLSIQSTTTGEVRELQPRLEYFNVPQWMPDGRSLMIFGRDLKGRAGIYRIDVEKGELSFVVSSAITQVQISPDGRKIYYRDPENRARILELDLDSGNTREVFESSPTSGMELSPDGRYLARIKSDPEARSSSVVLISVDRGEERELLRVESPQHFSAYGCISWTPDSDAVIVARMESTAGDPYGKQGPKGLWLVPARGGNARKLEVDIDAWDLGGGTGIRLHPNGDQITFFTGKVSRELWALENLLPTDAESQ